MTLVSCASSRAPTRWLDEPTQVPTSPYGAWIDIRLKGEGGQHVRGEFIALGPDSVYVLSAAGLEAVPAAPIAGARLEIYRSQTGKAVGLTSGGVVLSLSHGLGFIISGPVWLLVGSLTASGVSHEPIRSLNRATWDQVAMYARFPQGLPEGIDRARLKRKTKPAFVEPLYTVTASDGRRLEADRVEYSTTLNYLRVQVRGGKEVQIPGHKVKSIVRADGVDITREVMRP